MTRRARNRVGLLASARRIVARRPSNSRLINDDTAHTQVVTDSILDPHAAQSTIRDATSTYPSSLMLQRSTHYRAALDSLPAGVALFDRDRRFTYVNPALCRLLDRDEDWLLGQRLPDVFDPPDTPDGDPSPRGQTCLRRADGTRLWVEHVVTVLDSSDNDTPTYVVQFRDVTEARRSRDQLAYLASHDDLTQVANRRELIARMERTLRHPQLDTTRVAVLFLDVDGLKHVNDTYGHAAGDQLLIDLAARLVDQVGHDDIVARLGGDEFLICLALVASPADAETVAATIHAAFDRPLLVDGQRLRVSVGIGIAIAERGQTPEQVIRHADAALYRAKRSGSARTAVFDAALDDVTVADAVRTAIAGSAARVMTAESADSDPGSVPWRS